ncbi:MAG: DegV family protein [Lachnospiraceae bacterium]|nr:DegV family protein [Lachnospiraceae bacterium]
MGVKIITDSSADLMDDIKKQCIIVPLRVSFGDEEFIDGVTIDNEEFYRRLIEYDVLPTTSQATPHMFSETFEKVVNAGDTAVVITLASKLSGTYQSACIAASEFEDKIFVVDSTQATIGTSIQVNRAVELSNKGLSAKEIFETIEEEKKKVRLVAVLDTLEYLQKGGRISKAAAFAGGLLSIKPVIAIDDGEVKVLGKARGSKQGNNYLIKMIEEAGGVDYDMPIMLAYSGLSDMLLQKYIEDSASLWEGKVEKLDIASICPAIGTHVGPGAIAVAFFEKSK